MTMRNLFLGGKKASANDAASVRSTSDSMVTVDAQDDSDSDRQDENILNLSTHKLKTFFDRRAEDIFIVLDEPHKVFGPGDSVRGKVNLALNKPTKTLYTAMRFCGQVSVGVGNQVTKTVLFQDNLTLWGQRSDGSADKVPQAGSIVSSTDEQEQGTSIEQISSSTSTSFKSTQNGNLAPKAFSWEVGIMDQGRHVFEFEFKFPRTTLPSTVDFGRGSISYSLRCEHQKPKSLTSRGRSTCRKNLPVLDMIDVGCLPIPKIRHIDPDTKSKRKEGAGKVQAYVELVRAGYLKGDTIALNIQVHHVKPIKNMKGTIATLYRLSRFDSNELAPQSFRKDLSQSVSPLLVDPKSLVYRISPRLRIPADAFPTIKGAGPVSFRYFVEVVLDLNGRTTVWQSGAGSPSDDGCYNFSTETGGVAMETDSLKREKGSHCVVFEVIIGTKDTKVTKDRHMPPSSYSGLSRTSGARTVSESSQNAPTENDRGSTADYSPIDSRERSTNSRLSSYATLPSGAGHPSTYPRGASQYPLSKSELRQLENAVLPSEPPTVELAPPINYEIPIPSAPMLDLVRPDQIDLSRVSRDGENNHGHPAVQDSVPRAQPPLLVIAEDYSQRVPSQKEVEALQEQASAPPEDAVFSLSSAPSLALFDREVGADADEHALQLPMYKAP